MIRIIATLCALAAPSDCHDQIVATAAATDVASASSCLIGQPQLAAFMRDFPAYRLAAWRCEIGILREHA